MLFPCSSACATVSTIASILRLDSVAVSLQSQFTCIDRLLRIFNVRAPFEHCAKTSLTTNFRVTSQHIKVNFSARLSSFSLFHSTHPLILISHCNPSRLQGYAGNDSPSDVFMSVAEPSVSLQCCGKVPDVPPLCLMDGACLCIANLFYLLRQANPSASAYNQLDLFWSSTRAPTPHLFMLNVR